MSDAVPRYELAEGYSIARVINGCWQLSRGHREGGLDEEVTVGELERLAESGLTTFDCGDIYLGVETLLGRLVRRRSSAEAGAIQIHTKLVPDRADLARLTRGDVVRATDRSLRRLGVERLDLVQLHWWDHDVPGYVETALWLAELQRAGKIRLLGTTNFDVPRLRELLDAGVELASHQVQYSLLDRRPERGVADLCRRHGIALLAYGALAGGFLGERWLGLDDPSAPLPNRSLVKYRLIIEEIGGWSAFQRVLRTSRSVAARYGDADISSVAARYVLDRPQVGAVIIGARDARHLDATLRTVALRLTDDDHERLRRAVPEDAGPHGDVYELERAAGGPHARIMRDDLNSEQAGDA